MQDSKIETEKSAEQESGKIRREEYDHPIAPELQKKERIKTPHKTPEPESKNKNNILVDDSLGTVDLVSNGYHTLKSLGDNIFVAG